MVHSVCCCIFLFWYNTPPLCVYHNGFYNDDGGSDNNNHTTSHLIVSLNRTGAHQREICSRIFDSIVFCVLFCFHVYICMKGEKVGFSFWCNDNNNNCEKLCILCLRFQEPWTLKFKRTYKCHFISDFSPFAYITLPFNKPQRCAKKPFLVRINLKFVCSFVCAVHNY